MTKPLQKAVIVLGFGPSGAAEDGDASPSATDSAAVRRAVAEALDAGLKELIFITSESAAGFEGPFGADGRAQAGRVVIARQFAARNLGQALCGARHLLEEAPFILLLPRDLAAMGDDNPTALLLASYQASGGNLVAIGDDVVLRRDGSFAAIAASSAGRYLLQPAVLDALEENPDAGLAGALLRLAEAWAVTALPPRAPRAALQTIAPRSEAATLHAPRPLSLSAGAGD